MTFEKQKKYAMRFLKTLYNYILAQLNTSAVLTWIGSLEV